MPKKLLYYNSILVTSDENQTLPGIKRFSKFFTLFSRALVVIDRTGTLHLPVHVQSLFPIPAPRSSTKTYAQICDERATEILERADELDVPIYSMWSGGIDSTLVLSSLLKNSSASQKKRITVLMSENSILEYPLFYEKYIRGSLRAHSSMRFPELIGGNHLLVSGEHNDQLFGLDMSKDLILRYGIEKAYAPYDRDALFILFNERLGNADDANFYLDLFERLRDAAPIEIRNNWDFLWWINFALKWQSVYMRMLSKVKKRNREKLTPAYLETRYMQFYGTEDFQLWSMHNRDKKIKDTWETYKFPAKDAIFDFTKDSEYRDHKTKRGSLSNLFAFQDTYNFIDDAWNFYTELQPQEYYVSKNDFV